MIDVQDNGLITCYYKDLATGRPITKIKRETQTVNSLKNVIQTMEVPDRLNGITILDDPNLIEVNNFDEIENENQYWVDYNLGNIYFHPNKQAFTYNLEFGSKGYTLISADKIFTKLDENGNVVQVMGDIIDAGKACIDALLIVGDATQVLFRLEGDIAVGNTLHTNLQSDITTGQPLHTQLRQDIAEVDTFIDELNQNVTEGKVLDASLKVEIPKGQQVLTNLNTAMTDCADDIANIVRTDNGVAIVTTSQWGNVDSEGFYNATVTHDGNSKDLNVEVYDYTGNVQGESVFISIEPLTATTFKVSSSENTPIKIVFASGYYGGHTSANTQQSIDGLGIDKQNKTDNALVTTSKNVVGAINEVNEYVGNIIKESYITDTTISDSIVSGLSYNTDYYRNLQARYLSKFYSDTRQGLPQKICLQGDSKFYGYDISSSDKRPADTTPCPDGSVNTFTRAGVTPGESLQQCLDEVLGTDKVTVTTRGFSGDDVKKAYNRWITPCDSNITLFAYGVNDSIVTQLSISEYLAYYEKLICRELLRRSAVILCKPSRINHNYIKLDSFVNSIELLALKYGIPVIDLSEFQRNYDQSIFSDSTHENGKGYKIIGTKLSGLILSEIEKPLIAKNGIKLLTRPQCDGIVYNGAVFESVGGAFTPAETVSNKGIVAKINNNQSVYYSFYTDSDDMVVIPIVATGDGTIKMTLDFGIEQPIYSCNYILDKLNGTTADYTSFPTSEVVLPNNKVVSLKQISEVNDMKYIHIATKGWHTLKISVTNATTTTVLNGIQFMDFFLFKNRLDLISSGITQLKYYKAQTHASYSDTTDITTTSVSYDDLDNIFGLPTVGFNQWKSTIFKLTVFNYNQSVLEYFFMQGDTINNQDIKIITTVPIRHNISSTPTNERTVSNVTWDVSNKAYVINWSGTTNKATSFQITIA